MTLVNLTWYPVHISLPLSKVLGTDGLCHLKVTMCVFHIELCHPSPPVPISAHPISSLPTNFGYILQTMYLAFAGVNAHQGIALTAEPGYSSLIPRTQLWEDKGWMPVSCVLPHTCRPCSSKPEHACAWARKHPTYQITNIRTIYKIALISQLCYNFVFTKKMKLFLIIRI